MVSHEVCHIVAWVSIGHSPASASQQMKAPVLQWMQMLLYWKVAWSSMA